MDFNSLIHVAQKNDKTQKNDVSILNIHSVLYTLFPLTFVILLKTYNFM